MIKIDNSKTSIYIQIKEKYKSLIQIGAFKDGEMLPSVRSLAMSLGINPNTVERAYQCLEEEGYINILPKKGAIVTKMHNVDETKFKELEGILNKLKKNSSNDEILQHVKEILKK